MSTVLSLADAELLAERTLTKIALVRFFGRDRKRDADRERVASDLACLRLMYRIDRIDQAPYADLTRVFSDNLRRTAALYGIT